MWALELKSLTGKLVEATVEELVAVVVEAVMAVAVAIAVGEGKAPREPVSLERCASLLTRSAVSIPRCRGRRYRIFLWIGR